MTKGLRSGVFPRLVFGLLLVLCSILNINVTAESWLRNIERTIRCKWISCLSEVILENFQMDAVIIIGTFVALINPLLSCQTMKLRYHKWAYSTPTQCYHAHVKSCSRWWGHRRTVAISSHSLCHPRMSNSDSWHTSGPGVALRPSAASAKTKSISG